MSLLKTAKQAIEAVYDDDRGVEEIMMDIEELVSDLTCKLAALHRQAWEQNKNKEILDFDK
jgi:hypothetical protein